MINANKKNVGIFVFKEVEILDFAGPYEVFSSTVLKNKSLANIKDLPKAFNTFTVSEENKIIHTSGNLLINSKHNFNSCPKLDILIIPGGLGTRILLNNKKVLNWINSHKNISILASVCTGSLLLAKAGLLKNKSATTHWGAYDILKKISSTTNVIKNKKYVYDTYYTSAGVSSGIDMSLKIVEKICGKQIAKNTAKYIEYKY